MKSKTLLILIGVTAVAIALAVLAQRGGGKGAAPVEGGQKFFADLTGRVNDAASLTVKKGANETTITRKGDAWVLGSKSDYPVEFEKVKEALVGLADMKVVETKTANPEYYDKLGVNDPAKEGATSKLVTVKDAGGKVIAALIIGNQSTAQVSATEPAYFVRKPEDAQSWLVVGRFNAEADPLTWMKRDMISVEKDRIKSVTVTHEGGGGEGAGAAETVRVFRDARTDAQFLLQDKPADRELKFATATDQIANGLSYMTFEDVRPASEIDFDAPASETKEEAKAEEGKPEASKEGENPAEETKEEQGPAPASGPVKVEFRAFDGLVIDVRMATKDGKTWAKFNASFDEAASAADVKPDEKSEEGKPPVVPATPKAKTADEVKKEVADLNARLSPWAFALPEYRAKQVASRMADMLKEPVAPAPAPGPAGPQPEPLEEAPSGPVPLPEPK